MAQNVAFYSGVTEYESGMGNRPDGYLVAKTEEQFNAKAIEIRAGGSYSEFSAVNGEPVLCLVTDDMEAQLIAKGAIWLDGIDWKVR